MNDDEVQRTRERMHKLADQVQVHDKDLVRHALRLDQAEEAVDRMRDTMVTSEQLKNAVTTLDLKLSNLHAAVEPIRRGVSAVVWLIVSSIIVAILGLLLVPR